MNCITDSSEYLTSSGDLDTRLVHYSDPVCHLILDLKMKKYLDLDETVRGRRFSPNDVTADDVIGDAAAARV